MLDGLFPLNLGSQPKELASLGMQPAQGASYPFGPFGTKLDELK